MRVTIVGAGPAGLYLALLLKKADPRHDITIHERNRADDTFGFGVVFSDETLNQFLAEDADTHQAIRDSFAYWHEIDVVARSEEHTSELQSLMRISYAVFCLKKKKR